MTIRLLCAWSDYAINSIVTLSSATEAGLIAARIASADLTGGIWPAGPAPAVRRMLFVGDSLTDGGVILRAPTFWDGLPLKLTQITNTNLGAAEWIIGAWIGATPGGGLGGTLDHDGTGRVRWMATGDTYGPYVDVKQGGWFKLQSGTNAPNYIIISVRGATAPPPAGSGAVTVNGVPHIADYRLYGFTAHVAGMLGSTFTDYRSCGIPTCTSADAVRYLPQALSQAYEACHIQIGVNDPFKNIPPEGTVANIQWMIDYAAARVNTLTVGEIFPCPVNSAAVQAQLAQVSAAIQAYCASKPNVHFVSAYDRLVDPNAWSGAGITGLAGAYHDGLHFAPYGAYRAAVPLVEKLRSIYRQPRERKGMLDTWNSVLQTGAFNVNPTLRGATGAGAGAAGASGPVPTSWALTRTGSTQACVATFSPAADGGLDFWNVALSGSTAGDYHQLQQSVTLPPEIRPGDWFRVVVEWRLGPCTGNGFAVLQAMATGSGSLNNAYVFQPGTSRNVANFNAAEMPIYRMCSEPQQLQAGTATFSMSLRFGAAAGGTAEVGFREFRLEKVPAPV